MGVIAQELATRVAITAVADPTTLLQKVDSAGRLYEALTKIQLRTDIGLSTGDSPTFTGLTLSGIAAEGTDVDKFLVDSTGVIKYRTGVQILSDIGGQASGSYITALTGEVTATGPGSVAATIAADAVTYAKMQNVSTTDKILGRATAGAGNVEEIACTAAGRAILDDANATAQATTLGLGTGNSPTFAGLSLGTGELTCGSINRASGTLTLEIGGTAKLSITTTAMTFGGNLIIPDNGYIGTTTSSQAWQIDEDGAFLPGEDGDSNIGSVTQRISEIFLLGDISDGTNARNMVEIEAAYDHSVGTGGDHSQVQSNITQIAANVTAIGLNTTHRGSDGSNHGFIDQAVTVAGTPTFAGLTLSGNLLVNGGDIGITADTNLLQLADGVLTVNGSIAGSSFLHTGDPDTGIFMGGDTFYFQAGGVNMLKLSELGIGQDRVIINDDGANVDFIAESIGSANCFTLDATHGNITINAAAISAHYDLMLAGDGILGLKEGATPTADTNYGKVYCKDDNKLYFQDGAGVEHEVAFAV